MHCETTLHHRVSLCFTFTGVLAIAPLVLGITVQAGNVECRSDVGRYAHKKGIKMDEKRWRAAIELCQRGDLERAKQFLDSVDVSSQPSEGVPAQSSEPEIAIFEVDRSRISGHERANDSATLRWRTQNADVVLLGEPEPSNPVLLSRAQTVPAEGSLQVSPPKTTTYVLKAQNGSKEVLKQLHVEVVPPIDMVFEAKPNCKPSTKRVICKKWTLSWKVLHATERALLGQPDEKQKVHPEGHRNIELRPGTKRFIYKLIAKNEFESIEGTKEVKQFFYGGED